MLVVKSVAECSSNAICLHSVLNRCILLALGMHQTMSNPVTVMIAAAFAAMPCNFPAVGVVFGWFCLP